jgi:hypothetical protein
MTAMQSAKADFGPLLPRIHPPSTFGLHDDGGAARRPSTENTTPRVGGNRSNEAE